MNREGLIGQLYVTDKIGELVIFDFMHRAQAVDGPKRFDPPEVADKSFIPFCRLRDSIGLAQKTRKTMDMSR